MFLLCISYLLSITASGKLEAKYHPLFNHDQTINRPVQDKLIKDMNYNELVLMVDHAKKYKDLSLLKRLYLLILATKESPDVLQPWRLETADFLFEQEDYDHAGAQYKEFCELYPGCKQADYAMYKYILCYFYQTLQVQKDQTLTQETIDYCDLFLKKTTNQQLLDEVKAIRDTCRKRIFDHEVNIIETYLKHKKYKAAQLRLDFLAEHFKDIAHLETYLAYIKKMIEICKNPETRPFMVYIDLQQATSNIVLTTPKKAIEKAKSVAYFMA